MKSRFLFPRYFRPLGWLLIIPGFILGYFVVFQSYEIAGFGLVLREKSSMFIPAFENLTNELALTMVIIGLLFVAFARLKQEDELTALLRLNALYWAILVNYIFYGVLLLLMLFNSIAATNEINSTINWLTGNMKFMIYNLFMPLVIFIGRFYYLLHKSKTEYQVKPLRFLPHKPYNLIGKVLSIPLIIIAFPLLFGIMDFFGKYNNFAGVLFCILPFIMLIWVYSKEKQEDKYINHIRLEAMQIAVYGNYAMLLLSNLFLFSVLFLLILWVNLITIPLIFLIVFKYRMWKLSKQDSTARIDSLKLGIL
ncbi:hypothetical protein [Mucilaginibacter terrae]|uniref:DUF4870 domain-containing protein n=1 Tax=Mucilaginibacter terrae TaxID=1955052 RepID=A0ABU3GWH6_9SPHI|nr:hypothetical protein [Mucilaginibacter terrae]MDT3404119.1 hypothetical protein [Mucilaginibacter terrae]